MKKWLIPLIIIIAIGFGTYKLFKDVNNNAVTYEEEARTAWSNVESAYQRRADLIPNLVRVVQGAADFEKTTLTQVIEARAKATSTTIDVDNLTPESMKKFQEAQAGLSSALSRLLVSVERYPELKANANFQQLQSQLEGTENRINVERNRYNESVKVYNVYIRKFPNNIVASILSFERMNRFQADEGAEKAPNAEFDFKS